MKILYILCCVTNQYIITQQHCTRHIELSKQYDARLKIVYNTPKHVGEV